MVVGALLWLIVALVITAGVELTCATIALQHRHSDSIDQN